MIKPDFILESSWEVCNKVGGIYTVLSTRAKTLQEMFPDRIVFIGPDVWGEKSSPYFMEDEQLLADWRRKCHQSGLEVKVGRWDIPGKPIAVLVDFQPYFARKNDIYTRLWEYYQVDSLHAYGDYDEASMFSYAAGLVVERLYLYFSRNAERGVGSENGVKPAGKASPLRVVYQANEWMTGLGLLYINKVLPQVATIFTTHATSIGRSIAGNNKPLYDYLFAYHGDQMAGELNMQSKHSIEKQTAHHADCFTTVSDITARECMELLDKPVDVVLPNGFENDFVPKGVAFTRKRKEARKRLIELAGKMLGTEFSDDVLMISTSGRFEFRNKGIDLFIETMHRLEYDSRLKRDILAFVMVPGCQMQSWREGRVALVFLPYYLTGNEELQLSYYDALIGNDLCIYPSYYEPWGYTPLEAIAFKIPCITSNLAGFGRWVEGVVGKSGKHGAGFETCGVEVVERTDYNYMQASDDICNAVTRFSAMSDAQVKKVCSLASKLSEQALWSHFIRYYEQAYDLALRKAESRSLLKH